jgi:tetratricopeptide (TPR) repeat protein
VAYISDEIGLKPEAAAHYEQARALWEELVQAQPDLPEYLFGLAKAYSHMGIAHQEWARWDDGRAALEKAIPILERLIQDHPRDPQYPSELARVYHYLGTFYRATQKPDQAEEVHRKALELRERLTRDHPGDFRFTLNLATSFGELGNLKRDTDQPAEALDWYARNIRTLEALLQTEPRSTAAREFLTNTYDHRAALFLRGGQLADAARDWRRIVELSEGQSHLMVRVQRAAALARLGEHARAVAEIEQMLARGQEPPFALYNFACVYSLSSAAAAGDERLESAEREKQAGQYAARAVALLLKARDAGFFKEEGFVGYLEKDLDLAALYPREDFQKLLRELKGKK